MEAGYSRLEVQPGDGQPGAGHRRADVRAGGPPHRREAGPHPQARPSPTRSPASRRPPCAARPAGGDPTMPRSPGCCWTPGHGSRNAPGSTPRTSRSPPKPARSACTARAMRSALSPWPGEAGNWSWHGWTCAARCARLGGRRKPAGRARLLCAGRDLAADRVRLPIVGDWPQRKLKAPKRYRMGLVHPGRCRRHSKEPVLAIGMGQCGESAHEHYGQSCQPCVANLLAEDTAPLGQVLYATSQDAEVLAPRRLLLQSFVAL